MSSVEATKSASQRFPRAGESGSCSGSDLKSGREGLKRVLTTNGAPQPLACPFRKRHPLRFNIRDASSCCRPFNTISDVIHHLIVSHSRMSDKEAIDPEDGIGFAMVASLYDRASKDRDSNAGSGWSSMYQAIFPKDLDMPSPYYTEIIEHFDYYAAQEVSFNIFAGYLKESIDVQQLNSNPLDYIMGALKHFVETTFQYCASLAPNRPIASGFTKDRASPSDFENFVDPGRGKREESMEGKWAHFPKNVEIVEKSEISKREKPPHAEPGTTTKAEPLDDPPQVTRYTIKAESGAGSENSSVLASPSHVAVVDLTDVESFISSTPGDPEHPAGAHRDTRELIADSSASALTNASESPTPNLIEGVAEWQLREILNHSCHSILGADLDSIANSRLLYDTLIDLADEFAGDLIRVATTCIDATDATASEGRNDNSASSTYLGSDPSGPSSGNMSSRKHFGGRDSGGKDENGDGSGKRDWQSIKSSTSSKAKAAGVRLPCPFRMMYPGTFNVRTHYSCSMTYFPTIGRLKDHLREHHKRQDGAEVLCPRCFTGFRTREELHRHHSQADIICQPSKFDPKVGLHGEAINLLRGRDRAGQSHLAQWREICNIIFQDDRTVPPPEYHAVMEHFEFVEELIRSFPDLLRCLHLVVSEDDAWAIQEFGAQAASIFTELYCLGADHSRLKLAWQSRLPTVIGSAPYSLELQNLGSHCLQLLKRFADNSRSTTYENDGSRGNGGRRSRRAANPPDRLQLAPPISRSSPRDIFESGPSLSLHQDEHEERVAKRPRLLPALGPVRQPPVLGPARRPPAHVLQQSRQLRADLQSSTPPSIRPANQPPHSSGYASLPKTLPAATKPTSHFLGGPSNEAGETSMENTEQPTPHEHPALFSAMQDFHVPFGPFIASPNSGGLHDCLFEHWDMDPNPSEGDGWLS
ncbi:hypothetical protein B0T14DRAFT_508476 [Immersiella caudata]|uniref:C2H2-type domain-containing protein n=1 Tax=Immersiella caudata TaxID=314043 RepID=A0AA39XIC9_9PEZI|nr:hypothetical protein B0T14DRAFT_508476 [Immersiella caudata]